MQESVAVGDRLVPGQQRFERVAGAIFQKHLLESVWQPRSASVVGGCNPDAEATERRCVITFKGKVERQILSVLQRRR